MNLKRLVSYVMALCLAFSVSTAMAAKGGKSDKSGKGGSYSQKSDHGKKGKSGNSGKSDKSGKSGKSSKSGKSGKSEKSSKDDEPASCVSDWEFFPDAEEESGFVEGGVITGTACWKNEDEVLAFVDTEFSPDGAPDTVCLVSGPLPEVGLDGTYELDLVLVCNTNTPPPPPPPAE